MNNIGAHFKIFTKLNYTVEEAKDGVDALQKIFDGVDYNDESSISNNRETKYDIIFIDNLMPRISGTQCINILRTRGITTPIVSFTGSSFPDERNVIISHGANYVIKKPGYLNDIKKVILALKNEGYFESKLRSNVCKFSCVSPKQNRHTILSQWWSMFYLSSAWSL